MQYEFLADRPDAVAQVAQWYFNHWGAKMKYSSYQRTYQRVQSKLNRTHPPLHVLATSGDNIMGVAQLKLKELEDAPDDYYWLGGIYVSEEFRRQGVARALALHIEELAKSFGISHLHLVTTRTDGGLFAKLGWEALSFKVYLGERVLLMHKVLG